MAPKPRPTHLFMRAETKPHERRAPLTPSACKEFLEKGFRVTVETSDQRIFEDKEYEEVGCAMVEPGTWRITALDAYIIGLKEIPMGDRFTLPRVHIYFAHCYKGQEGARNVLARHVRGDGLLFDMEFLKNPDGSRVAGFGFHAGFSGCAVGVDVWSHQQLNPGTTYPKLEPYPNEDALIEKLKGTLAEAVKKNGGVYPKILIIGALGRCGRGAVALAHKLEIPEENIVQWDMAETASGGPFQEVVQADIFLNCIYLTKEIPPFITQKEVDQADRKLSVIVDVSCDPTSSFNPVPLYKAPTTFDQPTLTVASSNPKPLELVAIDHLPTLLPREASEQFCKDLVPSLTLLKQRETAQVWQDAEELYRKKAAEADLRLNI